MVSPSTSSGQAVPNHDPSTQKVMNEKKEARDSRASFLVDVRKIYNVIPVSYMPPYLAMPAPVPENDPADPVAG
jgi:hypothetical protein